MSYIDNANYIEWDFRPYLPVRPYNKEKNHFLRENVFIHRWQRLMTRRALEQVVDDAVMREDEWFVDNESWRYPVLDVFNGCKPSVHDTRIASNFILYLGLNAGSNFLNNAEKLSKKFHDATNGKPSAYLSQWTLESNPYDYSTYRTSASPRFDFARTNQGDLFYQPEYRDVQTLEKMAWWSGTDNGQIFIRNCMRTLANMSKRYYPPETESEVNRRTQLLGVLNF